MAKDGEALAITTQVILLTTESHSGYWRTHKNKTSGSEMFRKPLYGGKGNYTITKVGVICYFDTDVFKRVAGGNHD